MTTPLFAALPGWKEIAACPTFWGLAAGALGLWLLLPTRVRFGRSVGSLLLALAGVLLAFDLPLLDRWVDQGVFWLLAAVTLGAAACTITSHSPVYSAIWFALSLLGTAGLFLFQGAQFLGVATVVIYAGAIVVTFLFVIMLAQPEGRSPYDRLTWGGLPKVLGVVAGGALIGVVTFLIARQQQGPGLGARAGVASASALMPGPRSSGGVQSERHVATFGGQLWSVHLISIELAGTLLLVALVGAVAIAIHGRPRVMQRIEEALR